MICRYCGSNIIDDSKYCSTCGKNLETLNPPVATAAETLLENSSSITPPTKEQTSNLNQIRPWVRCWARTLDYIFFSFMLALVVIITSPTFFSKDTIFANNFIFGFIAIFLWVFVESICLALFGTTPGKFIFSTKVKDSSGNNLPILLAMGRSFGVWSRGVAGGIPFVSLFTYLNSYNKLKSKKTTDWDESAGSNVIHGTIGFIRIATLIVCLFGWLYFIGQLQNDNNRQSARSVKETWETFHDVSGHFKIEFPTPPKIDVETNQKTPDSIVTYNSTLYTSVDSNQYAYIVMIGEYSKEIHSKKPKDILTDSMNGSLKKMGNATLLNSKFVEFSQFPSLDYQAKADDNFYINSRLIFANGNTLYAIAMFSDKIDSLLYNKFLDSFAFIEKEGL